MAQGLLENVTIKTGVSKKSGKSWARYDVIIGGEKYGTFDSKLGNQAMQMQNQMVEFSYNERQNGAYINYDLTGLSGGNGAIVQPTLSPVPPTGASQPAIQPAKNVMEDNKDKRTAFMYACELVKTRNAPKSAFKTDEVAKEVEEMSKLLYCILQDLGKAPIEVAGEIFTATEDEQEPVI